jgi:hypothetical protein
VLRLLPPGICELELACPCAGPLPAALQRFRRLEVLRISGNGAGVRWASQPAVPVLPKLRSLGLDYRQPPEWDGECCQHAEVLRVPASMAAQLAPATCLASLELRVKWSDGVRALCRALPGLRELE